MRFIEHDDDEEDEDMDGFMSDGEYENIFSQQNALEGFHLHILEKNLKAKILFECFNICKNSIFWFFYSDEKKLMKIKNTYENLIDLLEMKE